jgi:hypothetical protein
VSWISSFESFIDFLHSILLIEAFFWDGLHTLPVIQWNIQISTYDLCQPWLAFWEYGGSMRHCYIESLTCSLSATNLSCTLRKSFTSGIACRTFMKLAVAQSSSNALGRSNKSFYLFLSQAKMKYCSTD